MTLVNTLSTLLLELITRLSFLLALKAKTIHDDLASIKMEIDPLLKDQSSSS
jgi:hypothetical protein